MNVLIIEDEKLAAHKLLRILTEIENDVNILAILCSVEDTINWFVGNKTPDLIFMDVQLEDGICFEIFEELKIENPIIFTTAFDKYAISAFKQNSVDYLLKPIVKNELQAAINKFKIIHSNRLPQSFLTSFEKKQKERFLVKMGNKFKSVQVNNIALFYVKLGGIFILTCDCENYAIDHSLDAIEQMVSKNEFFRISRTVIIKYSEIKDMIIYSSSRLKLRCDIWNDSDLIVSRDRVNEFKNWMDR